MRLLYELAADVLGLLGVLPGWGYWELRAAGFSQGDIRNATFTAAGLGALFLLPESKTTTNVAFVIVVPLERFSIWLHRQGWWKMTRLFVLGAILVYQAFTLGRAVPVAFPSFLAHQAQVADNTRELANHGAQIDTLLAWKKAVEDRNYPERVAILEQAVIRFEKRLDMVLQVAIAAVLPGIAWVVQQVFKLLMKAQKDG